ncbi:3-dehydroquinate synthase [Mycoplasmatota bacterium WC44]
MKLRVNDYEIVIKRGILDEISNYLTLKETVIVTDDLIPKEYILKVKSSFNDALVITVPHGETAKSLKQYEDIMTTLIESGFTRDVQLIALGGGVVGDLTGFVASTFMRGVDFVQIPTSLLAQIDSSVGGKVAINFGRKNIIGSFYNPKVVLIDPNTLSTLDERHFNNGMAEMIKYGLIKDSILFERILNRDIENIEDLIYRCLEIKRDIVLEDEKDYGIRHILNFGHTIAHGIEMLSEFDILHGEAVGIGMLNITKDEGLKNLIKEVLRKYQLPTVYEYSKDEMFNLLLNDKKVIGENIKIILLERIGKAYIKEIRINELKEFL